MLILGNMNTQDIGQKIKEARKRANMTQEAVAALFGEELKRQAVRNWEAGTSFPKPFRWPVLEQAFSLPQGWFLALKSGGELPAIVAVSAAQTGGVNNGTVAGVVHQAAPVASAPMGGDIARELSALIAERLEGQNMDTQIAIRARVKAALEGAVDFDLEGGHTPPECDKVDFDLGDKK